MQLDYKGTTVFYTDEGKGNTLVLLKIESFSKLNDNYYTLQIL